MKTRLIMLVMLMVLITGSISAQNKVTIVVDGIENIKGQLVVGLYDKETYMKKPFMGTFKKIEEEVVTVEIENVPNGEYAVSLFQDENENWKIDTGAFGIPTEKYGASNNAKGKMGPPKFEDCKFTVDGDIEIYITLI